MQTIAVGENVRIVFDGQRIAFARIDLQTAQSEDLAEAEMILELLSLKIGGNC